MKFSILLLIFAGIVTMPLGAEANTESETLKAELEGLTKWAQVEASQIGARLIMVDPQFSEVRAFGKTLIDGNDGLSPTDVIDRSEIYWKARISMIRGDQSVIFGRVLIHLRSGEIDRAMRLMDLIRLLPDTDTEGLKGWDIFEKIRKYVLIRKTLVNKGVEAFDSGDKEAAQNIYKTILSIDPSSAHAWHEMFLVKGLDGDTEKIQNDYKEKVYGGDPLCSQVMVVFSGTDFYESTRRLELEELFSDHNTSPHNLMTYATIALDLGEYGFAAEWFLTAANFGPEQSSTAALEGFVYCLLKLKIDGVSSYVVSEMGFDTESLIKRVEKAYSIRLNESEAYKSFKSK